MRCDGKDHQGNRGIHLRRIINVYGLVVKGKRRGVVLKKLENLDVLLLAKWNEIIDENL